MDRRRFLLSLSASPLLGQTPARPQRHVVIISLDGFPAFGLRDNRLPAPTLRRLASHGAVAGGMETVNPTVTWPNHTSIITGVRPSGHNVVFNGLVRRGAAGSPPKVEPWIDKSEMVQAPTLYDAVHAAGMTTAQVDWVAIHNAKTITWAFPEVPRLTDPVVKEMMAAGTINEADVNTFNKGSIVWRDEVWTQAAEHIIEKHKPNLLLYHLLTTDSAQHTYGASSLGGNTALALADARVGRIVASLERAGILARTTIFVVSDHGFKTFMNSIHPNAVLRREGLVTAMEGSRIDCDAWVIPEGGTAMVYVTRPEKRAQLLPRLESLFATVSGVSRVVTPKHFAELGYPTTDRGQMADLVLVAADGYAFSGTVTGEAVTEVAAGASPGSHGYPHADPAMDAIFVASGAGIKPGVKLDRMRNVDVAPTAAKLLGVAMPKVEGRVLSEILQ
jgi:predicted AlkP superfamily pyrophosphatase or phosphodiesterase